MFNLVMTDANQTNNTQPRVLVVEDSVVLRKLVSTVLTGAGLIIDEAEHGQAALEHIQVAFPDLVLCDLFMPIMDGRTFIKTLRSEPRTAKLPVIIFSADDSRELTQELLSLGANSVVDKSAPHHILIKKIYDLLEWVEQP